jgi:hypothetical protein
MNREGLRQMRGCGVRLMRQIALCERSGIAASRAYAVTADENNQYRQAATAYETHLAANPTDLEATANLAVLYWEVTRSSATVTDFSTRAAKRLGELLDQSRERFPHSPALYFWRRYITQSLQGVPADVDECRHLMLERPGYLEPAFVIFSGSGGLEAEAEAMRLLVDCAEQPTARNRHIICVITGVLRWQSSLWA